MRRKFLWSPSRVKHWWAEHHYRSLIEAQNTPRGLAERVMGWLLLKHPFVIKGPEEVWWWWWRPHSAPNLSMAVIRHTAFCLHLLRNLSTPALSLAAAFFWRSPLLLNVLAETQAVSQYAHLSVQVKGHRSLPKCCSDSEHAGTRRCAGVYLRELGRAGSRSWASISRAALNTAVRICHGCFEWRSAVFPLMEHYKGWCHPIFLTRKSSYSTCNYTVTILLHCPILHPQLNLKGLNTCGNEYICLTFCIICIKLRLNVVANPIESVQLWGTEIFSFSSDCSQERKSNLEVSLSMI